MMTQATSDDKWGYFRPGYFPVQDNSIAPAMIYLSNAHSAEAEPNVQFILVKAHCYQKAWEDALFISEHDFDSAKNYSEQLNDLMENFMQRGYLRLDKIKHEVKFLDIH